MEHKNQINELLSSLEQIAGQHGAMALIPHRHFFNEFEQLCTESGLERGDIARVMGVSISTVQEWEAGRIRPSLAELKLMRLLCADPSLYQQLME